MTYNISMFKKKKPEKEEPKEEVKETPKVDPALPLKKQREFI